MKNTDTPKTYLAQTIGDDLRQVLDRKMSKLTRFERECSGCGNRDHATVLQTGETITVAGWGDESLLPFDHLIACELEINHLIACGD